MLLLSLCTHLPCSALTSQADSINFECGLRSWELGYTFFVFLTSFHIHILLFSEKLVLSYPDTQYGQLLHTRETESSSALLPAASPHHHCLPWTVEKQTTAALCWKGWHFTRTPCEIPSLACVAGRELISQGGPITSRQQDLQPGRSATAAWAQEGGKYYFPGPISETFGAPQIIL